MQKLHFETLINAPVEKVWDTMLSDATYREWTRAFAPGSHYEGSWNQGSKMLFLGPDPDSGKEMGMVSRIKENRPYEFVSIEHLGIVQDGIEDTESPEAKKWSPAFENYTFVKQNGFTQLQVDMDIADEYKAEFEKTWPKALEDLKALSEK